MKLIKKIFIVGALLTAGTSFAAGIATVNGKEITEEEFKLALKALGPSASMVANNPDMRERFLQHIIDSHLLSEKAKKEKLTDSKEYKTRLGQAESQILAELVLDQYIKNNSKDKDLKTYFNKNKDLFAKSEIKASHILIKDEKVAAKVLKETLKKGADFIALAKKHSTGPSGPKGGDLGWFGKGRMVPEFEQAAFATKKNQVHPKLVKTKFGFHIIKVVDIKDGKNVKFEDSKTEIKGELSKKLREKLTTDLRKAAKIEINKANLTKMKI